MKTLRFYNTTLGWIIFLIAAAVYLLTLEPTSSLWDCGEFIASAFKLQVGHPPGAPLFMIAGRFFSLFSGGDVTKVALLVNAMSGLASAFTILFLFWTITHLAIKLLKPEENIKRWQMIAILGSASVGSLAYTFSDTFWFSAVEGEVYASSSLFTAVVFWAILKWENVADEKYSNRWLILIAYLMGLSIGVHLLNLLAIPAIVMVYYYKKQRYSRRGLIGALIISALILASVMYILIPGIVWIASRFELLFVNGFGMKYNSGVLIYALLLIGGLVYGILYTHKHRKVLANTIILCITAIIIGYSSFSMIVIRSLANPPMDENSPETVFALLYYLNREQYGDRPLFYGQYFNAPRTAVDKGKPMYTPINGKYEVTDYKENPVYSKEFSTFFPRMYSSNPDHISTYMLWTNIEERDLYYPRIDENGNTIMNRQKKTVYDYNQPKNPPSFAKNIQFFIAYQIGHMYFRYFMWNFAGRQNDEQAGSGPLNGNWISGINAIDGFMMGSTKKLPKEISEDPSRNKYYLLPLLLGLIGLFYQTSAHKKDLSVVAMLFIMTGIAIVVYLNQTPDQPRERDYAYAGSFYAFAIWIGLGVLGIVDLIGRKARNAFATGIITVICLFLVPGIMAGQNWDDHDRSGRYLTRDIAYNYLNSCAPNAILFTGGDNDTFPLWYAQEVEGIRTDVRVVNLMLLNMDWYIDQMKNKVYESDPLPILLRSDQYRNGTRDAIPIHEVEKQAFDAKDIINFITSDNPKAKLPAQGGGRLNYVPARSFFLPVDSFKVIANGTVKPENANQIENLVFGRIAGNYLTKSNLAALDIIRNNNWERPVYFVGTNQSDEFGLSDYVRLEGLAYRLVPVKTNSLSGFDKGGIDKDIMYENLMNKFQYGRMETDDVYLDNFHRRTVSVIRLRYRFLRLANELITDGDYIRAEKVLDRIVELTPEKNLPYDMFMPGIADAYYQLSKFEKANKIMNRIINLSISYLEYFETFSPKQRDRIVNELGYHLRLLGNAMQITKEYSQLELAGRAEEQFSKYYKLFSDQASF
jgi:tetratricopeptide (TPR) repeat protein